MAADRATQLHEAAQCVRPGTACAAPARELKRAEAEPGTGPEPAARLRLERRGRGRRDRDQQKESHRASGSRTQCGVSVNTDTAIKTIMIHSRISIRRVAARSVILP